MSENFIARVDDNGKEQLLIDHLTNVAKKCADFAADFDSKDFAYLLGLLHDAGKYSDAFQRRIRGSSEQTDHSTAGAQILYNKLPKPIALPGAYTIMGHHSGLPDCGSDGDSKDEPTLKGRLKKALEDYSGCFSDINLNDPINTSKFAAIAKSGSEPDFSFQFYIRMLYSCLVDADFLDTEEFMTGRKRENADYDFEALRQRFSDSLKRFEDKEGLINEKRREILRKCIESGRKEKGIFGLSVPTGGGKTMSSLAFAMEQVAAHKLKRIIYVIPYTSIIEQTASQFKNIFGEDKVLEHHYNYEYDYDEKMQLSPLQQRLKLASENWDFPIIVTTNVQFFESLFANKSSRCRKLHNLAQSVIVFDEVQMFNYDYLLPCLYAIRELVKNYGTSVLLCSATMPDFSKYIPDIQIQQIIDNSDELNKVFKRVNVNKSGNLTDDDIIDRIKDTPKILTIVNSRKTALNLYKLLGDKDAFCLTTLLTPKDRKAAIEKIRQRLAEGRDCKVISTQLIEAGVDIDFPVVYRELSGIDSIVQSAGRCNREGRLAVGEVFVYETGQLPKRNLHLRQGISLGQSILNAYENIISPEAIRSFFDSAYKIKNLDTSDIMLKFIKKKGSVLLDYDFKSAANVFKLIQNNQLPVIIQEEENKPLIEKLKYTQFPRTILRLLQPYTVSVFDYEFQKLQKDGKIDEIADGIYLLGDGNLYDSSMGLNIFYDYINEPLIK
ncbi:MAG: CRISPR-associated helicase Cas3' [Clostridiales bacterium]|nr:CRISPR-associated helicase Cas3' [Clostridiales bacterium]